MYGLGEFGLKQSLLYQVPDDFMLMQVVALTSISNGAKSTGKSVVIHVNANSVEPKLVAPIQYWVRGEIDAASKMCHNEV